MVKMMKVSQELQNIKAYTESLGNTGAEKKSAATV